MYEPTLGRFLSRDPVLGGSANDYEYTSGDPVNRLDLSGMCATSSTSRCGMPRCCGDPGFIGPCPMPSPVTIGSLNTFDVPGAGPFKVVGTSGNQVFIIDTRTGELIAVDLGSAAAPRRIHYYAGISYSEAWADMMYVNFAGPRVNGKDDFRPHAVTFMRTFKEIPYFAAGTIAAAPVTFGANAWGQASVYYPEPSPAWGWYLGGII